MKKYYIAGPMRGYPDFNFPAFYRAADYLRARGHYAFNPAEVDVNGGFNPDGKEGTDAELEGFDLRGALLADATFILTEATHLWMLPGWHKSCGANAERWLGLAIGLGIEGAAS